MNIHAMSKCQRPLSLSLSHSSKHILRPPIPVKKSSNWPRRETDFLKIITVHLHITGNVVRLLDSELYFHFDFEV